MRLTDLDCIGDSEGWLDDCTDMIDDDLERDDTELEAPFFLGKSGGGGGPFVPVKLMNELFWLVSESVGHETLLNMEQKTK